MQASITFPFNSRQELDDTLRAFLGNDQPAGPKVDVPADELEPAPEKPKRGRPAKAEQAEPAKAEPEKTKKAALGDIVGAIRSFVLADKVGNMRKLISLMPEGKKSLDALDLEEAQRIALQLGLEVD